MGKISDSVQHSNSIVRLRGLRGWSLRELALASRIDEWALRELEVGGMGMHAGHMRRLSITFDCTVEELCTPCVSRRNPQISRARSIANLELGRGAKRWAGKLAVPEHAAPLVRELFGVMNEKGILIREAATGSGVSARTISDWRYRRSPTLDTFVAVLENIGCTLQIGRSNEPEGDR